MSSNNGQRGRGQGRQGGPGPNQGQSYRGRGRGRGDSERGSDRDWSPAPFNDRGQAGQRGGPSSRGRGGVGRGGAPGPSVFSPAGDPSPGPDQAVAKCEDKFVAQQASLASLSLVERFPRRPGYAVQGKAITLRTNYFEIKSAADLVLHRYSVEVVPAATGRKLQRIFSLLLQHPTFAELRHQMASDYASTLISRAPLPDEEFEVGVNFRPRDDGQSRPDTFDCRARVQFTGLITVADLLRYLQSTDPSSTYEGRESATQALNIVLARFPNQHPEIAVVGKNRFFPLQPNLRESAALKGGMEALRGYFSSVRLATGRVLLNVNVSNTVTYQSCSLADLLRKFYNELSQNYDEIDAFVKGVRVRCEHLSVRDGQGRTVPVIKTVLGLAHPSHGRSLAAPPKVAKHGADANGVQFYWSPAAQTGSVSAGAANNQAGRYVRVRDYFAERYRQKLRWPDLPVVNVGSAEQPSFLPAEVCTVLAGQVCKRKLTGDQTQQVLRFACRQPPENAVSIVGAGSETIGLGAAGAGASAVAAFGLAIEPRMIHVPGRILNGPDVTYRLPNRESPTTVGLQNGSWNMQRVRFNQGATLQRWTTVQFHLSDGATVNMAEAVIDRFHAALTKIGLSAAKATRPGVNCTLNAAGGAAATDQAIDEVFRALSQRSQPPTLALVILPSPDAAVYNRVKFLGDVRYGIHTVCVQASKFGLERGWDQYAANVSHKVNLKFGGTNQQLHPNKLGLVGKGKTMVVGLDVTHPSPGSATTAPSIAGIVASVGPDLAQWPAALDMQESRKEMISGLTRLFRSRLQLWAKHNKKKLPENVLVYRDGVSEGQYETVLREELPLLRAASDSLYSEAEKRQNLPRITLIIVGKRHHTRFYPVRPEEADGKSRNPVNGTVVDRGVTEARQWDFFLQAHTGLQGTARPAHYFVVHDEIFTRRGRNDGLPPGTTAADEVEQLTHNMCYLFGRATKAVSICPPAYYADLVCERARCYMGRVFNAERSATGAPAPAPLVRKEDLNIHARLENTMFYI